MIRIVYVAAFFVLLAGCADHSTALRGADSATITVYIAGGVNTHGFETLTRPFTVEHAIQQAGGFELYEQDLNRKVHVRHKDGSEVHVRRVDYGSFILADGDAVIIPRH